MKVFNQSFVHGDLQPQNVLHSAEGYKIIDFDWTGSLEPPALTSCPVPHREQSQQLNERKISW